MVLGALVRQMITRLVPEISPCDSFCDVQQKQQREELRILVVGCIIDNIPEILCHLFHRLSKIFVCFVAHKAQVVLYLKALNKKYKLMPNFHYHPMFYARLT